jgi:hypothetical protein
LNLVFIEGSQETLVGLDDIADLILDLKSAEEGTGGNVRVGAYATDRAIGEIESRGATVTILQDNADLQATLDDLFTLIENSDPGGVV